MGPEAKQRRREKRERAAIEYRAAISAMRSAGKSCANCRHFGRAPIGLKDRICDLDSDFDGYVVKMPGDVCPRHDAVVGSPRDRHD